MTKVAEITNDKKLAITNAGKAGILMATSLALLASPLVAPIMNDLSVVYADKAQMEPFAQSILRLATFLPGEANVIFLVKFILLSIPALFIVVGAPIAGWVVDVMGRKNLLVASLILFAVAGVSGRFVDSFFGLFVGRALLGLAVAGIKSSTITMAGDFFEGAARTKFLGAQGSAMKVGGVVFMLLGGYMAEIHWSSPFWCYLLALIALPNICFALPESKPATIMTADGSAIKQRVKMFPAGYAFLGALLGSAFFYLTVIQMSFFLRDAFELPNFYTGLTIAIANMVSAVIAFKFLAFKTRLSYVHVFAFIYFAMAVGYFVVVSADSYMVVLVGMVIAGFGFGLIVPAQSAWIIDSVPASRRGFGVGVVTTGMFLGQFLSPIVFQPFVDPLDPFAIFRAAAYGLLVLAVIYTIVGLVNLRGRLSE